MRALLGLLVAVAACAAPPTHEAPRAARPNLLLIVADDLGFADLGAYGSEIPTPNLDRLARDGMQLTGFHVAASCSPTRSMLLTGVDNHRNGLGSMGEFLTDEQRGRPGYEGRLNARVATAAEILADAGYDTFFSGKWHLGTEPGTWPSDRGFARSFALLVGAGDNWSDRGSAPIEPQGLFVRDAQRISREPGMFSSQLYTDELLAQLESRGDEARPFFAVLSFQAVHWPHHAPAEDIARFARAYDAGWDDLRRARVERLQALGIVAPALPERERSERARAWSEVPAQERALESRRMAVYAAMTANMDAQVGRVLRLLEQRGIYDDTLIVFVSDNGPDPSQPDRAPWSRDWYAERYPRQTLADVGLPGSFSSYGPQWAQLGSAHLRGFKGSAFEGGLRVPLIATWRARIPGGRRSDAFGHVTDVLPTLLEAAGVPHPAPSFRGREVFAPDGVSLLAHLEGRSPSAHPAGDAVGYALFKDRALFQGDWKLVRVGPPTGDGAWHLYDLRNDPSELRDLADAEPQRFARMQALYAEYARDYGVISAPDDFDVFRQLTRERERRD
jgi:arylsulfatase A-like enzyme